MKLNSEMCEISLNNQSICTRYNDDYVVLRKRMPVADDKLEWYVNSLKNLKNSGVNIATIVDYKLLSETKNTYGEESYTQGIFLEERAKGNSLDSESIYLKSSNDYDFCDVIRRYLGMVEEYLNELVLRAMAPQDMFNKLVDDCFSIQNIGLEIDPKPLNFFFDKNVGYTIIDVIPGNNRSLDSLTTYFPKYMCSIIFGYGKPSISVDFHDLSVLPQDMIDRLNKAGKILEAKIVVALRKFGFDEKIISEAIAENRFRYEAKLPSVEIEDMEEYIAQEVEKFKSEAKDKDTGKSDFFTISV